MRIKPGPAAPTSAPEAAPVGEPAPAKAGPAAGPKPFRPAPDALAPQRPVARGISLEPPRSPLELLDAVGADPSAYGRLPSALQDNVAFAMAALRRNPKVFAELPPHVQAQREVALLAVTLNPQLLAQMPAFQADPEVVTRAAEGMPFVLESAAPALLNDPAFMRALVQRVPRALLDAAPALRNDRAFNLELVRMNGRLLEFASESMRADPEVARSAIAERPAAALYMLGPLRDDRALALATVRRDGYLLTAFSPALAADREVALAAVRSKGYCLEYVAEPLRGDPEVVAAAVAQSRDALNFASPALLNDVAFISALAAKDPLVLDQLARLPVGMSSCLAQVEVAHPDLAAESRQLRQRLDALHLSSPERIGPIALVRELVANREQPRVNDGRPLAVVVFPKADWNGAFHVENLAGLAASHRLMFYEASVEGDLVEALHDATTAQQAAVLIVGGHGERTSTTFSSESGEEHYLDFSDEPELISAGLRSAVEEGGHVVMKSCSTGSGKDRARNISNMMARVFPQANVWAPTEPDNGRVVLDAQGRFQSPGFDSGPMFTWHVPPKR